MAWIKCWFCTEVGFNLLPHAVCGRLCCAEARGEALALLGQMLGGLSGSFCFVSVHLFNLKEGERGRKGNQIAAHWLQSETFSLFTLDCL